MTEFDFTSVLRRGDHLLGPSLSTAATAIGVASALVSVLAAIWMWRRNRRRWRRLPAMVSDRLWLHGYVMWTFAATVVSFALSPTTTMQWQGFSVLHAAVLPVVLWVAVLLRSWRRVLVRRLAIVHVVAAVALVVCMALASPMYRPAGREGVGIALRTDNPMVHELGILRHTAVTFGREGTWTPDVFLPNPAEGR